MAHKHQPLRVVDQEDSDDDTHADGQAEEEAEREDGQAEEERDDETVGRRRRRRRVRHGSHCVRGKMDHGMEDYVLAEARCVDGNELRLYAIFDGHSGRVVAEYLQAHLFDNILNQPDFWESPKKAVKRAYKMTDEEILEKMVASSRGGSTAVTAILINGERLVVANVGDSRAVLSRHGKARALTVDHDPDKEKDLVESRGGFVSHTPGNVSRVDGQLAMTRAFGDARLKEHITAEPDVRSGRVDEERDELMILATDGLWKVMSNQEAVDCVRKADDEDGDEAAKMLIREALSRNSCDDIACVVVMFE